MTALAARYPPAGLSRHVERTPWPLALFIASMVVPADFAFELAGLRLDPQRIVLLGFAGGICIWLLRRMDLRAHDLCMIAAGLWAVLACLVHMPLAAAIERGGSYALETTVAYLLPSAFLATAGQMRLLIHSLFLVVAALAVLAGLEIYVGEHVIANAAAELMDKPEPFASEERLGMIRARVSFSHQILFGIFCASLFAFFWYEAATWHGQLLRAVFCFAAVFFSLSSAAILLFMLQAALIAGEWASRRLRHRMRLVLVCLVIGVAAVEMLVNGGLAGFVTRYLSLNPATAYYRQLIWMHITDDIWANPLLGTGGFWTRPGWMIESIDHLYFAKALFYGVPTVALTIAAGVLIGRRLFRRPVQANSLPWKIRMGWLFCVLGLAMAGLTVDYFGRALPFAMFALGLGAAWLRIEDTRHRGHRR